MTKPRHDKREELKEELKNARAQQKELLKANAHHVSVTTRDFDVETREWKYETVSVDFDAKELPEGDVRLTKADLLPSLYKFFQRKGVDLYDVVVSDAEVTELSPELVKFLASDYADTLRSVVFDCPNLVSVPVELASGRRYTFENCYALSTITGLADGELVEFARVNLKNVGTKENSQWSNNLKKFLSHFGKRSRINFENPFSFECFSRLSSEIRVVELKLDDSVTELSDADLRNLKNVRNLEIEGKNLSTVGSLEGFVNLERLDVQSEQLVSLPKNLNLAKLEEVNVNGSGYLSSYDDEDYLELSTNNLAQLKALADCDFGAKEVFVSVNEFNLETGASVPEFFKRVKRLRLDSSLVGTLDLSDLAQLEVLEYRANDYNFRDLDSDTNDEEEEKTLTLVLPANLKSFDLNECEVKVTVDYSRCSQLKTLKVDLENERAGEIPENLVATLEELDLEGVILSALPKMPKLQTLKLDVDQPLKLDDSLGELTSLKELEVYAPELELPENLGNLQALEKLNLVAKLRKLPESIGNLKELTSFKVDRGYTFGHYREEDEEEVVDTMELASLPASFAQLTKLEYLTLNHTKLQSLAPEVFALPNLRSIDLQDNPELKAETLTLTVGDKRRVRILLDDKEIEVTTSSNDDRYRGLGRRRLGRRSRR